LSLPAFKAEDSFLLQPANAGLRPVGSPQGWLGEPWVGRCIRVDSTDLSMSQVQQMDSLQPDAPVQRRKKAVQGGYKLLVVDGDAFALELAPGLGTGPGCRVRRFASAWLSLLAWVLPGCQCLPTPPPACH